ncbi:MAG: transglutaminase family protein [Parvibaculum sp.]
MSLIAERPLDCACLKIEALLKPGVFIDSGSEAVQRFTGEALQKLEEPSDEQRAIHLFNTVRDSIRYDPYAFSVQPEQYRASVIAEAEAAFCVPKAILLTASLRAAGIPAAVGFADVRNHLNSEKLKAAMKTDLFVYHGYVQLWLGEKSYKVTPAFNSELCERFGVKSLCFDGRSDALFHEFDTHGQRHMEYVADHGIFEDVPIETLCAVYRKNYLGFSDDASDRGKADADTAFAISVLK